LNSVHCWIWPLDEQGDTQSLLAVLSESERAKADSFKHSRHRDAYVIAHAGLRGVLARHLGCAASELQFATQAHSKPYLPRYERCAFNLAHTTQYALCAIGSQRIGIDIECLKPLPELTEMLKQICTREESVAIQALALEQRESAFYRLWVRKEARLKACGSGLLRAPCSVHVGSEPWPEQVWQDLGPTGELTTGDPTTNEPTQRWLAKHLDGPAQHLAALVVATDPDAAPIVHLHRMSSAWTLAS